MDVMTISAVRRGFNNQDQKERKNGVSLPKKF